MRSRRATDGGRPYFVMELVEGRPLAEYCRSNRLRVRERLALFVEACRGVQHAHQKGIVHRDLKPGNILVAEVDGKPVPKVIDFGIAKALGGGRVHGLGAERESGSEGPGVLGVLEYEAASAGLVTEPAQVLGTVPYLSPEQARSAGPWGEGDVDTRSDIYSLGVVLYELLAEAPPFDLESLRATPYEEVRRILREVDPPPPSRRVGGMGREPGGGETGRDVRRRAQNARELRGELDWVVMKAIEKDRERRYQTVEALSADLGRFLRDEPVSAGPPGRVYRVRKFARQHRRALSTAGVVFAALSAGLVVAMAGLVKARRSAAAEALARRHADEQRALAEAGEKRAKEEAERVRDGQRAVFALLKPERGLPADAYGRLLDFVASRLDAGRLNDYPQSEAPVRTALGSGYLAIREWRSAEAQFRRAAELEARLNGPDALELGPDCWSMGQCLMYLGLYDRAEPEFRRALAVYASHGFQLPQVRIRGDLAAAAVAKGDVPGAEVISVLRVPLA